MNRTVIALLIAIALIVFGAVLAGCSLYTMGGIQGPSTLITTQETITGDFSSIDLNVCWADITFYLSEDGSCYYRAVTHDNVFCASKVENGTLKIGQDDNRKWYQCIGINWAKTYLDLYLPKDAYEQLTIRANTSDVAISDAFTFNSADIHPSTGDLDIACQVKELLELACTTGRINLRNTSPQEIKATVTTGDITMENISCETLSMQSSTGHCRLTDVQATTALSIASSTGCKELTGVNCGSLFLKATSGSTKLTNVIATGNATLTSNTGDWELNRFDSANITINATTGDVEGTLLTEKIFFADTSTGEVDIPRTNTGGNCTITTTTGDIEIDIVP